MTDPRRSAIVRRDDGLALALRDLGQALAVPAGALTTATDGDRRTDDPARRARLRIERGEGSTPWWMRLGGGGLTARRRRRTIAPGLVLALIAVLILAAVAGAIGLGLPGIRIVQAPDRSAEPSIANALGSPSPAVSAAPSSSIAPTPSPTIALPLGVDLRLGDPIALDDAAAAADIDVLLPPTTTAGRPATAWIRDHRLSLVWPVRPGLPATREPGIGLILSEFRGSLNPEYIEKIVDRDTTVDPARVGTSTGYWISGAPHEIIFVDPTGQIVFDSRRIVGDTLIWTQGDVTYRLESGLDRVAAISLAETLR